MIIVIIGFAFFAYDEHEHASWTFIRWKFFINQAAVSEVPVV